MGPISIAELARILGRAPTALYFHIAKLERQGMLVRCESASKRAPRSALYPERASALFSVPTRPLTVVYQPELAKTQQPIGKLVRSMTATATRNFLEAYRPGAVVEGSHRTLWASRSKRRLSARELELLNRQLHGIVRLLSQSDRNRAGPRQPVELTFILTPGPVRPRLSRRRRG